MELLRADYVKLGLHAALLEISRNQIPQFARAIIAGDRRRRKTDVKLVAVGKVPMRQLRGALKVRDRPVLVEALTR